MPIFSVFIEIFEIFTFYDISTLIHIIRDHIFIIQALYALSTIVDKSANAQKGITPFE